MTSRILKNTPGSALVVKLGGSLEGHLPALLPVVRRSPRPLLIVPGGGKFADAIRALGASDEAAHWMAIAAMDQYGWLIASRGLPSTARIQVPTTPVVLLPYCAARRLDPLPHSWDVTSDSIAAWVAGTLSLPLVLLKSVDGITRKGRIVSRVSRSVPTDVVDPVFIPYVLGNKIPAVIINGTCPQRVEDFLQGRPVPGTGIGTTF